MHKFVISPLQVDILSFAKKNNFQATLQQFIDRYGTRQSMAMESLRELQDEHIVTVGDDLLNSPIGVTEYGRRRMGW